MKEKNANRIHTKTFKRGSRTYFTSSLFFPASVNKDVSALYAFVRVADDFVDSIPQDSSGFHAFRDASARALAGEVTGDPIIDPFAELSRRKGFDPGWTTAFLDAMEQDLTKRDYANIEETLGYVYGSAEVIGLFMARILGLRDEALPFARLLGRAMQYINFIRDMNEDRALGRRYLPLRGSSLSSLDPAYLGTHRREFDSFLRYQLSLYAGWQKEAEKGFGYIPRRLRIAIRTASDMYAWTARRIARRPRIVFERRVRPPRSRILLQALLNAVRG